MRKLLTIFLLLWSVGVSAQQTRPTTPVQKAQNSAYLDTSTGIRWYFDGVNWFAIPPYSPPNTILTGLNMTVVGSTLTVHTGTWRINNSVYTLGSNINFTLKPRDTITHYYRYEAVYAIGVNNGIGLKVDSLTPSPIQHQFGTDTLTVGYVLITPTSYQVIPPVPTNQFVFSNIGVSSPTQQIGSYPYVTTMKADTFKVGNYYIWPSYRGNSGDVPQLDSGGNVFWSAQAIYLPGFGLKLVGQTFISDTTKMSTIVGMMDTLRKNAAHFDNSFTISNDTIHLATTGVTPGSYTATNLTVNSKGQITAASNGSGGGAVTTLNNGLTLTGSNGQLGGTLVKNTGLTTGNFNYVVTNTSSGNTLSSSFFGTSMAYQLFYTKSGSVNQAGINVNGTGGSGSASTVSLSYGQSTLSKSFTLSEGGVNPGIVAHDNVDTVGLQGDQLFPIKNGWQYAQNLTVHNVAKAIADSVKGTISGGITALTGDATASGSGSVPITLATVNSNVGSFGDATHVGAFTVNAKGLITAASSTAITFPVTTTNSVALTNKDLSGAGNTFPTFNQNTTGTASNITASSNSTLTTLSALSLPYSQLTGTPSLAGYVPYTGATGNVNLGTNFIATGASLTPLAPIHAISTISTNPRGILSDQNTADAVGARITMRKSRGTPASPTVITTADVLGSWTAAGYDGTNYIDAAKVLVTSAGTIATNQVPAIMELQTANASGTLTDGIKIDQAQSLTFGAYGTGLLHSSSAGAITSSAVNLAGADVTGLLPNGNLANSTISGISLGSNLANLTATDATLTFSGSYNGSTARTVGLNVANANTWTAAQTLSLATANSATYGAILSSSTSATSGNQKWSTFIEFTGNQWRTDLGASAASSGDIGWIPVQAGGISGQMVIRGQFGSSSMTTIATFDPSGPTIISAGSLTTASGGMVNTNAIKATASNTNITLQGGETYNTAGDLLTFNPGIVSNSSGIVYGLDATQTLNQSSSATYIGYRQNLTETGLGSGGAFYFKGQIAGVDKLTFKDDGTINSAALTASKVVFTDASKNLTSTGIGTSSQYIAGDGSLGTIGARPHTIFTPTTGGTISLTNNQYNIINPSGTLVTLTVNLPSSPANNDCVFIKYTQSITTVTYANGTVVDGITAPAAGGLVVLTYDSGTTSWY